MNIFKIVFVIFIYNKLVESVQISNCCKQNYTISKLVTGTSTYRPDKFKCVINNDASNDQEIHGLRIAPQDHLSNIPNCEIQTIIKLTEQIYLGSNSCLTKWQNNTYAITCKTGPNDIVNTLNVIQKCCPFGQILNKSEKQCVDSSFDVNIFNRYFKGPIVFEHKRLKCPDNNDVIVEYFSDNHLFEFHGSTLILHSDMGKFDAFDINNYCLDSSINSSNTSDFNLQFVVRTCNHPNICQKVPCVRSCCPKHNKLMRIDGLPVCVHDDNKNDLSIKFHSFENRDGEFLADIVIPTAYGILHGQSCRKYKLNPDSIDDDVHYINHHDGSIHFPSIKSTYDNNKFCIEKYESASGISELVTFLCFDDPDSDNIKFSVYAIGILISCGFFSITLLVYLCVPKLRNLPGKILICLVLSLLVAYIGIAVGQMVPLNDDVCAPFAYFIYFTLMGAFAWMNVMCFDIWLTFGSTQNKCGMPYDRNNIKRFLLYILYALVVPALLTSFTICVTKFNLIDKDLQPRFGEGRCWFYHAHNISHIIFFLVPVGFLFLINFILFILTLKYCNQVKREIHRMQSTCEDKPLQKKRFFIDRARFMMNTKLFIVMGITWILELLSSAFYNRSNMFFWIISDGFNVLQGLLVFFIFVFKWRVWYAVLDRFGIKTKKRHLGGATTGVTTSTFAGSTGNLNLMRMKSMESTTSLNINALNSKLRLSPNF